MAAAAFRIIDVRKWRFALVLIGSVLIGLVVRWLVMRGANWRIDYDEGMIGLQALRLLRGQFAVFLPGQSYLGSLESYLVALCIKLWGVSDAVLKIVPLCLSGAYVATTGILARLTFGRRTGAIAALAAAVAPVYPVVVGLKAWGGYVETLVLGNLLFILVLTIQRNGPHPRRTWLCLGFDLGLAFWISWLIAFYAIPAGLVLIGSIRRARRIPWSSLGLALIAFAAGSAPFWLYNIQHPLETFTYLLGGVKSSVVENAPVVLQHFVLDLAPRLVSGDPAWAVLDPAAVGIVLVVYVAGVAALLARRRQAGLLALFTACFLPIYILSGFGNMALKLPGIDVTGRYGLVLHTILPVGIALLATQGRRLGLAATLAALALNGAGLARINPAPVFASPYYRDQPATLQPLLDLLDRRGIRYIWTQVGIAHVLMFETGERILAADYYDADYAGGFVRFPDVLDKVAAADRVAFVFLIRPGQTNTPADQAFQAAGTAYERLTPTPQLLVIIPRTRIDPARVLAGLGWQY